MTETDVEPELRTRIRDVPALAGIRWIRLGLRAFFRQPGGFMGLFGDVPAGPDREFSLPLA